MKVRKLNEAPSNATVGWLENQLTNIKSGTGNNIDLDKVSVDKIINKFKSDNSKNNDQAAMRREAEDIVHGIITRKESGDIHSTNVHSARTAYNNAFQKYTAAKTEDERNEAIKESDSAVEDALNSIRMNLGTNIKNNSKLGFLTKWVQSMKWRELQNPNNDFVKILKLKDNDKVLNDKDQFIKIYNKYANELIDPSKINDVSDVLNIEDAKSIEPGKIDDALDSVIKAAQKSPNQEDQRKARIYDKVIKAKQNEINNNKEKNKQ